MTSGSARPARERDNDFDAVRLLAAFAVLVGHGWALTGTPHVPLVAGVKLFDLGVYIFFSLSGYLIATSWARSPRMLPFLARRVFRIFPALVIVVLVSVFVLGPLVSTLGPGEYFGDDRTWRYLSNLALTTSYELPGVFTGNPVAGIVNGSLWTLGPEFLCYLGVVAIGLLAARLLSSRTAGLPWRRLTAFAAVGAALVVILLIPGAAPRGAEDVLGVVVFFAGGAVLAELETLGMLAPLRHTVVVVAVAAGWLVAGSLWPQHSLLFAWLVLPVIVIGFGSRSTPAVRRAARFGDFSYGLYLWGFPVQQVVRERWPGLPLAVDILIVAAVAGALAVASWWAVERRAIALGRRLSRRLGTGRDPRFHSAGAAVDNTYGHR